MVDDGLSCFFGEQADEGHLHGDGVRGLVLVPVSELETQKRNVSAALKDTFFRQRSLPRMQMEKEQRLTCVPLLMSAPNHTGLFLEELHHTLRGMLDGLAEMQVSPVSMLQCTLMASSTLPWFGSTQYSPRRDQDMKGHPGCSWTPYPLRLSGT